VSLPRTFEDGSFKFTAKIFSSNYANLLQAIEALIQDPYGCFEQISATTYPLVMALGYLNAIPEQTDKI